MHLQFMKIKTKQNTNFAFFFISLSRFINIAVISD